MTPVQLDVGQIFILIGAFATVIGIAGKLLLGQFNTMINTRFASMEESRAESQVTWKQRFDDLQHGIHAGRDEVSAVQRELLEFKAEVAREYARNEDMKKDSSTLEGKFDGLAYLLQQVLKTKGVAL